MGVCVSVRAWGAGPMRSRAKRSRARWHASNACSQMGALTLTRWIVEVAEHNDRSGRGEVFYNMRSVTTGVPLPLRPTNQGIEVASKQNHECLATTTPRVRVARRWWAWGPAAEALVWVVARALHRTALRSGCVGQLLRCDPTQAKHARHARKGAARGSWRMPLPPLRPPLPCPARDGPATA